MLDDDKTKNFGFYYEDLSCCNQLPNLEVQSREAFSVKHAETGGVYCYFFNARQSGSGHSVIFQRCTNLYYPRLPPTSHRCTSFSRITTIIGIRSRTADGPTQKSLECKRITCSRRSGRTYTAGSDRRGTLTKDRKLKPTDCLLHAENSAQHVVCSACTSWT